MKRNTSRKAEEAYLAETLRVVRDTCGNMDRKLLRCRRISMKCWSIIMITMRKS